MPIEDHMELNSVDASLEPILPVKQSDTVCKKSEMSIKSAIIVLFMGIVGAGTLTTSKAFKGAGLYMGLGMFIFAAFQLFFSLHLIVVAARKTKTLSFDDLARICLGEKASLFVKAVVILNVWGIGLGYIVASSSLIKTGLETLIGSIGVFDHKFVLTSAIFLIIVIPVSMLKQMSALRFTSTLAFFDVLFLVFVAVYEMYHKDHINSVSDLWTILSNRASNVDHFKWSSSPFLTTIPISISVFACQPYILPVYSELKKKTLKGMHLVMGGAISLSAMCYILVGAFGFMTFGEDTPGNILEGDYGGSVFVTFARLSLGTALVLSLPILANTMRQNFFHIFKKQLNPDKKVHHVGVTLFILLSALIVGNLLHDLSTIQVLLGCTTNPILAFGLPLFLTVKSTRRYESLWKKILAFLFCLLSIYVSYQQI
eukprot:TRINITY_DN778239_c0_g1_i1.p1 TRINITY_DN778239_c0_g1~~TRINITY_DN778239_c0_g1_i1.p1  ORF type:complete len:428 (+),score=55.64 TRINITY_DN778239_c0_g1_i1:138-1421(+)